MPEQELPEPILITVSAQPDPDREDVLIVSVDQPVVWLSLEDLDRVRWICPDGSVAIDFASAVNPFDPNPSSGGQYQTEPDGSIVSGILAEEQLNPEPDRLRSFKYTIRVQNPDRTRSGALDPTIKGQRKRVYQKG